MANGDDELTADEFDVLFDGLDLWENESATPELGAALMDKMLGGKNSQVNLADAFLSSTEKDKKQKRIRKETSAVLKTKLIRMRNKMIVARNVEAMNAMNAEGSTQP